MSTILFETGFFSSWYSEYSFIEEPDSCLSDTRKFCSYSCVLALCQQLLRQHPGNLVSVYSSYCFCTGTVRTGYFEESKILRFLCTRSYTRYCHLPRLAEMPIARMAMGTKKHLISVSGDLASACLVSLSSSGTVSPPTFLWNTSAMWGILQLQWGVP